MIIDCDVCQVRGLACSDCVVSVLLAPPVHIDDDQVDAIDALSDAGMVPPLRLVVAPESPASSRYVRRRNTPNNGPKGLLRARSAG